MLVEVNLSVGKALAKLFFPTSPIHLLSTPSKYSFSRFGTCFSSPWINAVWETDSIDLPINNSLKLMHPLNVSSPSILLNLRDNAKHSSLSAPSKGLLSNFSIPSGKIKFLTPLP